MKILITGSSKGIGEACAKRFLKEGFEVIGRIFPCGKKTV